MEENLSKTLSAFSIVFFIILAISLFFMLYDKNIETMNIVNVNLSNRGAVYQTKSNQMAADIVSGAVITGSIKNGLETDILVNGMSVNKSTSPDIFDFSVIDNDAMYSSEYIFNKLGEITLVKYLKR